MAPSRLTREKYSVIATVLSRAGVLPPRPFCYGRRESDLGGFSSSGTPSRRAKVGRLAPTCRSRQDTPQPRGCYPA